MEAVERLAGEAGMTMPARDPADAARSAANQGLVEPMEAAVQFFRLQLATARAAEARAYLDRRGLGPGTRDRFEIGFAPDSRTALLEHLTGKGFPRDKLIEAGLVLRPETGSPYDRFRRRITFPIRDGRGRCIAFGARAIAAGQEPKYLNSPDTPLFDKGRTLYNVGPARAAAAKAGTVVVTEGYMDVIALAEAGVAHAVAPLGTAITAAQLEMLWKLAPEPVVALDGDKAGLGAAQRLVDLALPLLGPGRSLRFALMPPGQDPDDVVRQGGAAALQPLLDASRPVIDLVWIRETEGQSLDSPERRAALAARLRAHVDRIADAGLRAHWEKEVQQRLRALFQPSPPPRGREAGAGREARPATASPSARASLLARSGDAEARIRESAILAGCFNHPAVALMVEDRLERLSFRCSDLGQIRDALLSAVGDSLHEPLTPDSLRRAAMARLGFDPMARLMSVGHVHVTPGLSPGSTVDSALAEIDRQLSRHSALAGRNDELRDAMTEIAASADDELTWRLRQAAEAVQAGEAMPEGDQSFAAAEAAKSAFLREQVDREVWRKPRRH
jgi:DNA primase